MEQAAILNAHAMAFLISLERIFDKFEFLVTNQPPFVLFADDEYVTKGSSSTELSNPDDRRTYHQLIFDHRDLMRSRTKAGSKNYKVVLHKAPLIEFLAARSRDRARRVTSDVQDLLRYPSFDLVIVDQPEPSDEFEVLAGHYPYSARTRNDAISIRHRRIGIGNTALYQLALIGMDDELVQEDYTRAEAMWQRGLRECERQPKDYAQFRPGQYAIERRRIVARILEEAFEAAHPQ